MDSTYISEYKLFLALDDCSFNRQFSEIVSNIVVLRVHHITAFDGKSAEMQALMQEKEKNTALWIVRKLIRLNKEISFLKCYIDMKNVNVVIDLIEDVYDMAITLMDKLNQEALRIAR